MLGFSKKDKIKSFIKILKKAAAEMEAIGFDDSNLVTGFAEMEAEITELEDNHTELRMLQKIFIVNFKLLNLRCPSRFLHFFVILIFSNKEVYNFPSGFKI
jgi:hypothetical protein